MPAPHDVRHLSRAWTVATMRRMTTLVAIFMLVMAVGIAGIWTADIVRNPEIDRSRGLLRARDRDERVLVPHWIAEYGTSVLLLVGGLGLVLGWPSGAWSWTVPLGLGALAYTSMNSLAWVLADRARMPYGVPMTVGFVGAVVSALLLLGGSVVPALP